MHHENVAQIAVVGRAVKIDARSPVTHFRNQRFQTPIFAMHRRPAARHDGPLHLSRPQRGFDSRQIDAFGDIIFCQEIKHVLHAYHLAASRRRQRQPGFHGIWGNFQVDAGINGFGDRQ